MKGSAPDELLGAIEGVLRARKVAVERSHERFEEPSAEEILSKVCALIDQQLYATTAQSMERQTVLEHLTEGILTLDIAGRITSANRFLCGLLGVGSGEIVGCLCRYVLEEWGAKVQGFVDEALERDATVSRESEVVSREGTLTPVEISAIPERDHLGEMVGAVCVFQDIARRRQVEALNRSKNDLTDMIVHDLRTPLTSLLTGLQTVPMLGEMNADQDEFSNISIEGGQILLGMINDLLDISKMEDGALQITRAPVGIGELLAASLQQVTALAAAKRLQLVCDDGSGIAVLFVDEAKLTRTLVNLLSNALKFTPEGGSITLAARWVSRPGRRDSVIFACRDTGEGIPESAFARIFEKFGQVEGRKAGKLMSTGLGLTFCKMAVEAHGGRIWVESALKHGSTFSFAIPVEV